mmetsp:Transcript_116013/g.328302  ORF Transcript_116013/g.328302 Transcript_116013/m.328302 type:complete len:207 (-) Transcript_116013:2-622(-)
MPRRRRWPVFGASARARFAARGVRRTLCSVAPTATSSSSAPACAAGVTSSDKTPSAAAACSETEGTMSPATPPVGSEAGAPATTACSTSKEAASTGMSETGVVGNDIVELVASEASPSPAFSESACAEESPHVVEMQSINATRLGVQGGVVESGPCEGLPVATLRSVAMAEDTTAMAKLRGKQKNGVVMLALSPTAILREKNTQVA